MTERDKRTGVGDGWAGVCAKTDRGAEIKKESKIPAKQQCFMVAPHSYWPRTVMPRTIAEIINSNVLCQYFSEVLFQGNFVKFRQIMEGMRRQGAVRNQYFFCIDKIHLLCYSPKNLDAGPSPAELYSGWEQINGFPLHAQ
jgi:hypothetical protein